MKVLETERLILRRFKLEDASFILQLVNEPAWLQYIGDKKVKTLKHACDYIKNGPMEMYKTLGFGMYLVELKSSREPIGLCGLIKRDSLQDVDLGFAFLRAFWGKGYARESASAVMLYGTEQFGIARIVAITSLDNNSSSKLLEEIGFRFESKVRLESDEEELKLYAKST